MPALAVHYNGIIFGAVGYRKPMADSTAKTRKS